MTDNELIEKYNRHKDCFVCFGMYGEIHMSLTLEELIRLTKLILGAREK